jgi:hypothetical protein
MKRKTKATKPKTKKAQKPRAKYRRLKTDYSAKTRGVEAREAKRVRMLELELPKPLKLKPESKEFKDLQAKWYKRLEADGFEDLEWSDAKTGKGQNTGYLKHPTPKLDSTQAAASELYYSMCRNYVTHNPPRDPYERLVFVLYSEGIPYREIKSEATRKLGSDRSLFYLYKVINKLKAKMLDWNKTSPNGLITTRTENAELMDKFFNDRLAGVGELSTEYLDPETEETENEV